MSINRGLWSEEEHDRFLEAIQVYPNGPWRCVAKHVGTRDSRQVQTHAQKYYEKITRHLRGLRKERRASVRAEHRMEGMALSTETQEQLPFDFDAMVSQDSASLLPLNSEADWSSISESQLPSLEEALDILLQCLADE